MGVWTVGVGHNLDAEGLCDEAIDAQLAYDIRTKVIEPLDKHLPSWRWHSESVRRALANLCFNLGITKLLKFKRTLAFIESRQYSQAADALLESLYAKQVGQRAYRVSELIRKG